MRRYTPGNCEHLTTQNQCLNARIGVKCVWHKRDSRCVQITKLPQHVLNHMEYDEDDSIYMKCLDDTPPRGMTSHEELCKLFTDCVACVQTSYNCVWCGKSCLHEKCRDNPSSLGSKPIVVLEECDANTGIECMQLHTCHACSSNPRCIWSWSNGPDRCKPQSKIRDREVRMRIVLNIFIISDEIFSIQIFFKHFKCRIIIISKIYLESEGKILNIDQLFKPILVCKDLTE